MADKKFTDLGLVSSLGLGDIIPVVINPSTTPESKAITYSGIQSELETYFDDQYNPLVNPGSVGNVMRSVGSGWVSETYPIIATQSDMETASDVTQMVTPGRLHYHPGSCKAWAKFGVTGNILASYNVASVTDTGTGVADIAFTTAFSSADYSANVQVEMTAATYAVANDRKAKVYFGGQLAGSCKVLCTDSTGTTNVVRDPTAWHFQAYGDQ